MPNENRPTRTKSPARRRLLRALTVAGGAGVLTKNLPDRWLRPAVESMVLPAHAQCTTGILNCHVRVVDGTISQTNFDVSINGPASQVVSIGTSTNAPVIDLTELSATLCDEVSGVPVSLLILGVQDPCFLSSYSGLMMQNTNSNGVANFGELLGGSVGDGCSWTLRFAAPGYGECNIQVIFNQ